MIYGVNSKVVAFAICFASAAHLCREFPLNQLTVIW